MWHGLELLNLLLEPTVSGVRQCTYILSVLHLLDSGDAKFLEPLQAYLRTPFCGRVYIGVLGRCVSGVQGEAAGERGGQGAVADARGGEGQEA